MESSPLFIQVHRLSTEYLNRVQCNPKVTWNWGLIGEAAKAATSTAERSSERAKEQRDPLFLDPTEVDLKFGIFGKPWIDNQIIFAVMAPFLSDFASYRYDLMCVRCTYFFRLLYIPSTWSGDPAEKFSRFQYIVLEYSFGCAFFAIVVLVFRVDLNDSILMKVVWIKSYKLKVNINFAYYSQFACIHCEFCNSIAGNFCTNCDSLQSLIAALKQKHYFWSFGDYRGIKRRREFQIC